MFRSLFARKPPAPPPVVPPAPDRPEFLPTLSDTATRAVAIAIDPDATLADFATLAGRDAALTAVLLKRAASAAYGDSAVSVSQAVLRLGLKTCGELAAAVGLRDILSEYPPFIRERCETLLGHSLFVANLSVQLNRRLRLGFHGEEYTGGLLHDIGRVVLSAWFPAEAVRVDPVDYHETLTRLAREQSVFGTDHGGVGLLFAVRNRLPEAVGRVCLHHHDPKNEWEHRKLVALVALADGIVNHVQRNRALRGYDPNRCQGYQVISERWEGRDHGWFAVSLSAAIRAALRDTRGTLKSFAG